MKVVTLPPAIATFVIVVLGEVILRALRRFLPENLSARKEAALAAEIKRLKKEANRLNTPSTFSRSALLTRTATAKEKELNALKAQPSRVWWTLIRFVLPYTIQACAYVLLVLSFRSKPVVILPVDVVYPFGSMLAFPHGVKWQGGGAVSVFAWLALTSRVEVLKQEHCSDEPLLVLTRYQPPFADSHSVKRVSHRDRMPGMARLLDPVFPRTSSPTPSPLPAQRSTPCHVSAAPRKLLRLNPHVAAHVPRSSDARGERAPRILGPDLFQRRLAKDIRSAAFASLRLGPAVHAAGRLTCRRSAASVRVNAVNAVNVVNAVNATSASEVEARIAVAANTGALDLSDCGLTAIPPAVLQLSDLTDLSLAGNQIESIPPAIANLSKLRRLGLAGNRLQRLPPEIGQLTQLEGLWLHGNLLHELPNEGNPLSLSHTILSDTCHRIKTVGVDSLQLPPSQGMQPPIPSNVLVSRLAGTGAAQRDGGYFKVQPWQRVESSSEAEAHCSRVLVVAFGSAPAVPNWAGLLRKVKGDMGLTAAMGGTTTPFDTLYVVDSTRSWYTHAPLSTLSLAASNANLTPPPPPMLSHVGAFSMNQVDSSQVSSSAGGYTDGAYYRREIAAAVEGYDRVVMIGDSMGASAALMFSEFGSSVLAFCPQVDLISASIRPGRDSAWLSSFTENLLSSMESHAASKPRAPASGESLNGACFVSGTGSITVSSSTADAAQEMVLGALCAFISQHVVDVAG
ncbi:unnamed protein product [Closterium sp. Yama58-4]|nr:unnamed protein product [Closterium sp. Yama58-4]